jgi:CelD/BcsL family acetyltransferase involved in cellulose biosynthesis
VLREWISGLDDARGSSSLPWRLEFGDSSFEKLIPVTPWQGLYHPEKDCLMASPAWIHAWWSAFGVKEQPGYLLSRGDDGNLEGVVPIRRSRSSLLGMRLRTVSLVENGSTPRAALPLLQDGLSVRGALGVLLDDQREWEILALKKIPRDSLLWKELKRVLQDRQTQHVCRLAVSSPYLKIDSSWEDWWASRSQKFRKTVRNQRNRAHRLKDLAIQEISGEEGLNRVLKEYESLCTKTWKHRAGTGLMNSPQKQEFLHRLIESLGPSGNLVLWALRGSGELVAAELHVRDACGTHALRSDFDEAFKDYSPGSALEIAIVENSYRKGYLEHDFCGEDYAYKLRWTQTARSADDFLIFGRSLPARVLEAWEKDMKPILRRAAARWRSSRP